MQKKGGRKWRRKKGEEKKNTEERKKTLNEEDLMGEALKGWGTHGKRVVSTQRKGPRKGKTKKGE